MGTVNAFRARIVIFCVCIILLALLVVKIYIENTLLTSGEDLGRLQEKIATMKKENMEMKIQLYNDMSYTTIASKAAAMGFIPVKSYIYLR